MKKLVCILLTAVTLSGCTGNTPSENTTEATTATTEQTTTTDSASQFTRDDFVIFCQGEQEKEPLIWLGMTEDYVTNYQSQYPEYFQGFNDIEYATGDEIEDGKATGNTINYVSLISYIGGTDPVETSKGICTAGLESPEESSSPEDIIKAYNIDTENEGIYIGSPEEDNYTIALYFTIDENNNVTRIKVPKDTDNTSVDTVNADYFIKFMITQDKVSGLQLYRKNHSNK